MELKRPGIELVNPILYGGLDKIGKEHTTGTVNFRGCRRQWKSFWGGLFFLAALLVSPAIVRGHHPHDVVDSFAVSPNYSQEETLFFASKRSINLSMPSQDGGFPWELARSGMRSTQSSSIVVDTNWGYSGAAYVVAADDLEIRVLGKKNPESSGAKVAIDAIEVVFRDPTKGLVKL